MRLCTDRIGGVAVA